MCDRYGAAAFGAPWHTGGDANAPAVLETLCRFALFDFFGNCPLSLRFRLEAVDQISQIRLFQRLQADRSAATTARVVVADGSASVLLVWKKIHRDAARQQLNRHT
jgi:hypothetical protein